MDSECQPEWRHYRGREGMSSWTLAAAGSTGGEKTDGKDEKAEKITHKANRLPDERMEG